ncbi:AarF/ABC1/UbiB kinase family protein [Desulfosporosinus sp. BICA1-9]|uniref:ABC1 kinase family protein n=1 Tax=Desulfosporosinus sp. BICA1-9 TaxID=1531958 RepID=UPI00054B67E5|nr:AarF/UbiB family protein [Desulfosporosinus sp. BICA1-9]KJS49998.1 MAG: protein kinase [Peptococcaceae bacterium BRH_c23]KJS89308.1 MAG: protein kinase [Desulfosporosinus sp. BICA1-9]HBW34462.1 protein kinase [Desulfosporosinus sp.]
MYEISARHFTRYYEILSVLIRHGLGYMLFSGNLRPMQEENLALVGVHLRNACAELGPAFVKVGQLASTRSDLLPQPIVQELAKLQDRVHPLFFEVVRRVVEESLKSRLESAYHEFDPVPLAAASIGQVHQAVLHNGERVAVKVQRPHLRETVQTDLEIFQIFVDQIEQRTQWGKRYPLRMLLEEFSNTIKGELDFVNEGRNAEKLSKVSINNPHILIPKIYWELTQPSVLTMEYISGIPLHHIIGSQEAAYDVHRIADRLSKALLQQILLVGCFHGDPHPGNILILPGEKIALLDFGITGHLTRTMRGQILSLMSALIRGNNALILETISQMGIVSEQADKLAFQTDISALRHKHLKGPSRKLAMGESIQDFFNIIFRHGIHIPSEFILVGKSLITLEGILNELDPNISLVEQAKPFSRRFIWGKFDLLNLWERIWGTR